MGPLESGAILTPRSIVMIVTSTSISFLLQLGLPHPDAGRHGLRHESCC